MIPAFCVVPLGSVVAKAAHDADLQHKDLYLPMGIDSGRFTKVLQGAKGFSLDLYKLWEAPDEFWWKLLPALAEARVQRKLELAEEDARRTVALAAAALTKRPATATLVRRRHGAESSEVA